MKKLILIIFFVIFLSQLRFWFNCNNFPDVYHFSASFVKLSYDDLIHNDTAVPFLLIRFYHNKFTLFMISLYTKYLLFWDVKFWANILLPAGIFGFACGIWYGGKSINKKWNLKILAAAIVFFPVIEILVKPSVYFPVKIALFSLPYEIFSLFGIAKFMETQKDKKAFIFLLLLLWLSVWWQIVLFGDVRNYCS